MSTLREPQFAPPANPTVDIERQKVGNIGQPEDKIVRRTVARSQPFLMDGDFLRVVNGDDHPIVFRWARKDYVVDVGEEKFVIFEALVDALGDPRSVDEEITHYNDGKGNKGIIMRRHDELTRLWARYGIQNEALEDWVDPHTHEPMPGLLSRAPKVSIESMDGARVTFPCQRPDMLPLPVRQEDEHKLARAIDSSAIERVNADNEELRAQVERLEQRLNDELARREGVDAG